MPGRRGEPVPQRRAPGGRGATSLGPHGRGARTGAQGQGAAARAGPAAERDTHAGDGDLGDDDDSLVKITFKADFETLNAIDCLIASVRSSSRVAQRRVRSEVIRRALIAAAAAVAMEHPSPREKYDGSDRGLTQSDRSCPSRE
jgi:hypothetical protein